VWRAKLTRVQTCMHHSFVIVGCVDYKAFQQAFTFCFKSMDLSKAKTPFDA
jgi:hypothetical protein